MLERKILLFLRSQSGKQNKIIAGNKKSEKNKIMIDTGEKNTSPPFVSEKVFFGQKNMLTNNFFLLNKWQKSFILVLITAVFV